ncbi:M20/M25/M40 family metallo-hydrolase [Paenibacillus sp. 1P07SE]|uniref:M20/M25/M40 family metallo-hydrolase n=1 Tax=Paenibacillus sp. 1P07SE TaxID=3132209 RepID=UPI0039A40F9F
MEVTLAETMLEAEETGYAAYQYLAYLTNEIGTREAGTAKEVEAGEYLKEQYDTLGLEPEEQPFTYSTSDGSFNSNNIIGVVQGASDREIIVGAHYDSVSTDPGSYEGKAYTGQGTDDNASGVSVMLEVAEAIQALPEEQRPYTVRFIAFGAEEVGLQGSKYYVNQMTEEQIDNTVAMINLDSLAAGDMMYIYGGAGAGGFVRDLGLAIADRDGLDVTTNPGLNADYPEGTTGDWSDHAPFKAKGIPYAYLEATNWEIGDLDGYTQTEEHDEIFHTYKDNLAFISQAFPGRIEERLSTFTQLLTSILLEVQEPSSSQTMVLDKDVASMTEKRTLTATFDLPEGVSADSLTWTYDGKPLADWKQWVPGATPQTPGAYTGPSFISAEVMSVAGSTVTAEITFDLPFGTDNLSPRTANNNIRPEYPKFIGNFELAAVADGEIVAHTKVKLTPYDSYRSYAELKPEIDRITAEAARETGRYIETTSIGKSVEGRDIYFTVLAKDEASVDQYQNDIHPKMMSNPAELAEDIREDRLTDYKVPIWLNNIHPDESPGVDVILNYFETMALEEEIQYDTKLGGHDQTITLNMDDALEHAIFIFVYTNNPDGRVHNTRANAEGFDLNRDNSYQTQPETQAVTKKIAEWSPLSFLDMHGFVGSFLIEPCTPPHDPNIEYDLLMESMLEQAYAMGEAGIANTTYDVYHIPYEENRKMFEDENYEPIANATGWDDASPAYTAVYALHHGALGHTLEMPELNEESQKALYYTAAAATDYVVKNKETLFLNQLEVYKRGVGGIDIGEDVDKFLVDSNNEVIGRPRQGNTNFFPEYYVLPVDGTLQKNVLEAYRMAEYLLRNGVQVDRSTEEVTVAGTTYPAGSYVVNMHQAKRGLANLVLYDGINVSDFDDMYADIVQNFHDMRGFDRYIIREAGAFTGKLDEVSAPVDIPATVVPDGSTYVVLRNSNNDALLAVNTLLAEDKTVVMLTADDAEHEAGDFVVRAEDLQEVVTDLYLELELFSGEEPQGKELEALKVAATGVPAYVLKSLGFEVVSNQSQADVLVNTSGSTTLIDQGKPYVGFGRTAMNTVRTANLIPGFEFATTRSSHEGLFRTDVSPSSPITGPYDAVEYFYTVSGSISRLCLLRPMYWLA